MNILYKSILENKQSHNIKWRLNRWYKITEPLNICKVGFHGSKNIIDAMGFVNMGYAAKVEVRGESIIQKEKECWSEMRIMKWKKWTKKDSISLTIFAAELVIDNFEKKYPNDKRPREAIKAAKAVLKNDNKETRSAAESAASAAWSAVSAAASVASATRSAAWSAAWSAESVAESVAESAAASAAESAARSAESVAWSAESVASATRSAAASAAWSAARSVESAESAESVAYKKIITQCHDFVIKRAKL